jgi:hypothetical protein
MEEKTEMDRGMGGIPPDKHPEILRTAHKYRIDENDPAWILVKLAVESLGGVEKIAQTLRESSVAVTAATAAEVKASREKAALEIAKAQEAAKAALNQALSQTMSAAVQRAIDQIVQSTHVQALKIQSRKWALIGAVTAAVLVVALAGGVGWEAYRTGLVGGYASGVTVGGNFRHFMDCDRPGWKLEQKKDGSTWCYPWGTKDGTYGWRVR